MVKNHHFPYSQYRIFNDHLESYGTHWKKTFPEQYLQKGVPNERCYRDGKYFLDDFIVANIAETGQQTCLRFLNLANQFIQGHFRLALNHDQQFTIELDGQSIQVVGKHTTLFMSVDEWDIAHCIAVLLRDEEHMISTIRPYRAEHYIAYNIDELPIDYPYYKFLQGLYEPDVDLEPMLHEIVALSDPSQMSAHRQSYVYDIRLPFIEIILAVLDHNEEKYVQAIIHALDSHILYYSNNARIGDPIGWLPLHICAGAAIAYDQCDFKLPLSSPYLPEWLIYQEFDK